MGTLLSVSDQETPNQVPFSEEAQQTRAYTFILREPGVTNTGGYHPYTVMRNGASVQMSGELTLFLNPQDFIKEHPARIAVHQTPNGAWVDSFGLGLPRWTVKGTTGWRARAWSAGFADGSTLMDGYLAYHAFADLIAEYYNENKARALAAAQPGAQPTPLLELVFRDHWDDEWWIIEPEGIPTKIRSHNKPLTIDYTWRFTGLSNIKDKLTGGASVIDPTGLALVGGNARFLLIGQVMADTMAKLQAANTALTTALGADPASKALIDELANCSLDQANTESDKSAIARSQAYASAESARQEMDDWESGQSAGSVNAAQQAALTAVKNSSYDVQGSVACGGPDSLSSDASGLSAALNSAEATGIPVDTVTPTALSTAVDTVKAQANNLDPTKSELFSALTDKINAVVTWGESTAQDAQDFANGVKETIATPLKEVQDMTTRVRKLAQTVSFAMNVQNLAAPVQQALRQVRTQLRGSLCALQSLAAFPYNFEKGLRNTLQDMFNLFSLSGCASTFPTIKGVSWKPSLPLKVVT